MAKTTNVSKRAKSKAVPIDDSRSMEQKRMDNVKKRMELCDKIIELVNSSSIKKNENPSMRVLARKLKVDQRTLQRYLMLIQHIQSLPKLSIQIVETEKVTYVFNMENEGNQ